MVNFTYLLVPSLTKHIQAMNEIDIAVIGNQFL